MKTITDIFIAVSKEEGLKIGQLERNIGASKGVLSRAINNGTDVQSKWLTALIEKYPHYNYEGMLKGDFSTIKETANILNDPKNTLNEPPINYEVKDPSKQIEDLAYTLQRKFDDVERALKVIMLDVGEMKLKSDILDAKKINQAFDDLAELKERA